MDNKRVADYFIIAGLPDDPEKQTILDESSLEVNLKPSHNQVGYQLILFTFNFVCTSNCDRGLNAHCTHVTYVRVCTL